MPRSLPARIKIETPSVSGSIALKGARIDDLLLEKYRETVNPASPAIVLFRPSQNRASVLCGIRLGARNRLDGAAAGPEHRVAAGGLGRVDADQPGDAEI